MPGILITGSNRGLGLEWARQYAQAGWRVFATCRHPAQADALRELRARYPGVSVYRLDVTSDHEIHMVANAIADEPVDVLVNNAGVYLEKFGDDHLGRLDYEAWLETFRVNTLGAVRVTEAFAEHVAHSTARLVVAITSHMGSIAEIDAPGSYAYRSSKAALNAAMRGLSLELGARRIGVLLLHPGWVKTRMGGPGARITPEESVRGMRALVERFDLRTMNGRFYRYDGSEIPW